MYNITSDTAVPVLLKARMAQSTALMLTYDDLLDEGSVPATSAFTVTVDGRTRNLRSTDPVTVSGRTVSLRMSSAVSSSATVTVRAAARRRSSDPPHREPSPE